MSIETLLDENRVFHANEEFKKSANLQTSAWYTEATENRLKFWEDRASELHWFKKWDKTLEWNKPDSKWFINGKLNACYNCLDVHLSTHRRHKAALIWEGENGTVRSITYSQLHQEVCTFAAQLKDQFNVKKGDRVTLYMPLIPELAIAVLACARLGAIHSVVFGGFSAKSLKDRLIDSQSTLLITADGGYRRGQIVPLKNIADTALQDQDTPVTTMIVVNHIGQSSEISFKDGRDHWYHDVMSTSPKHCDAEPMDSEDNLFILYTSGTTGKPKGIVHSTGGYMTHAKYSTKAVFDLQDSDVYWCTADIGWITGHTYLVYGPLANGATVLMYEGSPDYPDKDRFWDLVAKHQVSILYTAPTAIRAFMKWGTQYPEKHNLSSLRLLGTVGEPINPEAWTWYYTHIGQEKCPIVDTWWQTETGGIMISNLPALNPMKPGSAGLPLPGISATVLDKDGTTIQQGGGLLSLTEPWPSMLRGIWGDKKRYREVYWDKFPTYFAGDGATVDEDGYYKVLGRVDDVLNVAGHRIGTMEVESSIVNFNGVAEAAVVGMPDEIKGQSIVAFIILKEGQTPTQQTEQDIIKHVAKEIGAIAKPKLIVFTPELPKTRSGKIMRRLLKAIAEGNPIGDTTTLSNPDIVNTLSKQFKVPSQQR